MKDKIIARVRWQHLMCTDAGKKFKVKNPRIIFLNLPKAAIDTSIVKLGIETYHVKYTSMGQKLFTDKVEVYNPVHEYIIETSRETGSSALQVWKVLLISSVSIIECRTILFLRSP